MASSHHTAEHAAFNPADPHGFHTEHEHEHHVTGWKTLAIVLALLLFLTFLTVATAQAEVWVMQTFDVVLPGWLNIAVAMTIATIKAALVCLFFMQLLYDKPLNGFVFLFCLLALALFLFFTMLDLQTRDMVTDWKKDPIVLGGTGYQLPQQTGGDSLAEYVRQRAIDADYGGDEDAYRQALEKKAHHHTRRHDLSDANRSVPRTGIPPGLFDDE